MQLKHALRFVSGACRPGPGASGQQKSAYKRWLIAYRHILTQLGIPFPATDPRSCRIPKKFGDEDLNFVSFVVGTGPSGSKSSLI
jgi:hypothetical protein